MFMWVGCGVCDTPELCICMYVQIRRHQHTRVHARIQARGTPELCWRWRGATGLCAPVSVYARVRWPPNIYIHTYIHM